MPEKRKPGRPARPRPRRSQPRERPGGRRRPPAHCHCAGHRAILVFGEPGNATIRQAMAWALAQTNVQHRAHYRHATGDRPRVPNAAGTGWVGLRTASGRVGKTRDLGAAVTDCCFFEEILVMAHGSHPGLNQFLADDLGQFIQTRPVRKLTVWSCNSATDIYPGASANRHYYERLCGLLQPKACPCGCDLARCDGHCHDPDGNTRAGYHCPSVTETATLYLAAWEDIGSGSSARHVPARLGLDPADPNGQVLTSPDGRMRQVGIAADGSVTMRLVSGADVFAGQQVHADPQLSRPTASPINADWREAAAQAMPPRALHGYTGPTAAGCIGREGCLPGR